MNRKSGPLTKFVLFVLLALMATAGPLDDKTPAYFVDHYGPAKSSQALSKYDFFQTERGSVGVKGQFSLREYRQGDLRVQAVFFLPSLKPAAVRLQLNRAWTSEQIKSALAAYGGEWEPMKRGVTVTSWRAPDGSLAISMLTWIDIQSKTVVDMTAKTIAEEDAKRKAVPNF